MGQTFDVLAVGGAIPEKLAQQLKKAVGFRNIAVHNYGEIDWAIVHTIARDQLGDFTEFARVIGSRLAGQRFVFSCGIKLLLIFETGSYA
jgi:uncharacterized protein YutE (UPF0331/DUF86 family)